MALIFHSRQGDVCFGCTLRVSTKPTPRPWRLTSCVKSLFLKTAPCQWRLTSWQNSLFSNRRPNSEPSEAGGKKTRSSTHLDKASPVPVATYLLAELLVFFPPASLGSEFGRRFA